MAVDLDLAIGGTTGSPANTRGIPGPFAGSLTVNFADSPLAIQPAWHVIANMPAGAIIQHTVILAEEAVTGGTGFNLGTALDGSSYTVDNILDGADMSAAGNFEVGDSDEAALGGFFTAASELRLEAVAAATDGIITIQWVGWYFGTAVGEVRT